MHRGGRQVALGGRAIRDSVGYVYCPDEPHGLGAVA
jgi:hypothetical protein